MIPTYYCQRDYWDQLGRCAGITIHDYGCYLTAAAMIAVKYGKATNPPALNQAWMWLYVNGCDATDYLLPSTYPDIAYVSSPWGREHLFNLDPGRNSSIVQIDGTATLGYITHYLAWDHCEGGRVYAVDPWYGDLCDVESRYGNVIQKVAIYEGVPVSGGGDDDVVLPEGFKVGLSHVAYAAVYNREPTQQEMFDFSNNLNADGSNYNDLVQGLAGNLGNADVARIAPTNLANSVDSLNQTVTGPPPVMLTGPITATGPISPAPPADQG